MQYRNIGEELEITKFRKNIEREIENYFEAKGFSIIEPRVLQDYDDFIKLDLMQDSSKTVKVLGGDSKIYLLRPDITTNILRQIFSKWEGQPPLKVYYNSKIYKNGPRGEILQNYQMGIESLGDDSFKADGEIVQMAGSIMDSLGEEYIIELGSSSFLEEVFREENLEKTDENMVRKLIYNKNYDGLRVKLKDLNVKNNILNNIFLMQGDIDQVLDMIKSYDINKKMAYALEALEVLNRFFVGESLQKKIKLDLSLIADLDYYDGIIFKGYSVSAPSKILSGGRYDKSTSKYGRKVPAIGFMIDMDLVTKIRIKELK